MKKQKTEYNLLVLMDFSEASYTALKYVISLAKFIHINIQIFHVIKMDETDYELSTFRAFESQKYLINNKLKSIVEIIIEEGIHATYKYSSGYIENEISKHFTQSTFDIAVIGKRQDRLNTLGSTTSYLLHQFTGTLLVVEDSAQFHVGSKIAIACNSKTLTKNNLQFLFDIDQHTINPLKIINVRNYIEIYKKISFPKDRLPNYKKGNTLKIEYLKSSTIVEGLIEHLGKNEVDLFCIGRKKESRSIVNLFLTRNCAISEIIKAVNIPILIAAVNQEVQT